MTQPQLTGGEPRPRALPVAFRATLSAALLAAGLAVFVLMGSAEPPPQRPPADVAPAVVVATATAHDAPITFAVDGVVRPYRDLEVAAESGGRVVFKADNCQAGRAVRAGETLLRIDPRDYELEVQRLGEELEQAQVSVEELEVQIANVQEQIALADESVALNRRELDRFMAIRVPGAITESEIDDARRNLLSSRTSLQTQNDQARQLGASRRRLGSVVERTETQLATARLALERCELRSPIDGLITEEHVEQDGYVQKGALAFTVRDTSRFDVACSLRAEQLAWLWAARGEDAAEHAYDFPETPVTVAYELAGQRYLWDGVLARYDGAGLDSETRMAPCLVRVERPRSVRRADAASAGPGAPPTLLCGMFVEVVVAVRPATTLLRLPGEAIQPGGVVWAVEGGKLTPRRARVAGHEGPAVLVHAAADGAADAVREGDRVVVSPLASPREGQPVRPGNAS